MSGGEEVVWETSRFTSPPRQRKRQLLERHDRKLPPRCTTSGCSGSPTFTTVVQSPDSTATPIQTPSKSSSLPKQGSIHLKILSRTRTSKQRDSSCMCRGRG